jgi:hypothetical protein
MVRPEMLRVLIVPPGLGRDVGAEGLRELTAGCLAPVGAAELRVLIERPIRERRRLFVGSFFAFERDGVL